MKEKQRVQSQPGQQSAENARPQPVPRPPPDPLPARGGMLLLWLLLWLSLGSATAATGSSDPRGLTPWQSPS